MASITHLERPQARQVGVTLLLFAASVGLAMAIASHRPASRGLIVCSSAATAVGTLAVAWHLARRTALPRRGFMGAAVAMAAGVLIASLAIPHPDLWAQEALPLLWMQPAFFMIMAWAIPTATPRVNDGDAPRAGWTVAVAGAALAAIAWAAVLLSRPS